MKANATGGSVGRVKLIILPLFSSFDTVGSLVFWVFGCASLLMLYSLVLVSIALRMATKVTKVKEQ